MDSHGEITAHQRSRAVLAKQTTIDVLVGELELNTKLLTAAAQNQAPTHSSSQHPSAMKTVRAANALLRNTRAPLGALARFVSYQLTPIFNSN